LAATEPVEQSGDAGTASTGSRRQPVSARALVSLAVVALLVLGADQLTKLLVVSNLTPGERNPALGELLQFVFVKNSGAAFSLASGSTWIFSIAASAVTIFIIVFSHRIRSMAWAVLFGMLLGGTLGNLIDRLFREPSFGLGHVVDFIQVWGFPAIFNVADIFIVSSMGLFIILSIRGVRLDGVREASTDRDSVTEDK
jgi:signal peptidase II